MIKPIKPISKTHWSGKLGAILTIVLCSLLTIFGALTLIIYSLILKYDQNQINKNAPMIFNFIFNLQNRALRTQGVFIAIGILPVIFSAFAFKSNNAMLVSSLLCFMIGVAEIFGGIPIMVVSFIGATLMFTSYFLQRYAIKQQQASNNENKN